MPLPLNNTTFEKGTRCACKEIIRQGTKPVPCRDCGKLFHKQCTGLTRDHRDDAADGKIAWRCKSCEKVLELENDAATARPHEDDSTESVKQTVEKNVLTVLHWNAWGLKGKMDELEARLEKDEVDVAMIQETKLKEGRDSTPNVKGFSFLRCDRKGANGGGLATLVRTNISFEKVKEAQKGGTEVQEIRVKMGRNSWLGLSNVYVSPVGNVGFSTEMRLETISTNGIVAGDFNAHHEAWDEFKAADARGEEIFEWAIEKNLGVLNEGDATRLDPSNLDPSVPDITLVDPKWQSKCTWSVGEDIGGSDHLPVIIKVNSAVATQKITNRRPKWKSNVDWAPFTASVEETIEECLRCPTMKDTISEFVRILTDAGKTHVGKVKPGGRRKTCITPKVRQAIRKRNRLRKQISRNRAEWREACSEVKQLKLEARENAWKEYLEDAISEKDYSKVFSVIRSLNGCPDTNNPNEALVHNGKSITSDIRKADVFMQHYASVGRHKFDKEERSLNREVKKILCQTPGDEGAESSFSMSELNKALKKMNKKSAPGSDDIPPSFLVALGPKAKQVLLDIFNLSFNNADVPQLWRNAIIIPLLKAGKPASQLASFRPISLTSCVVKLFERMMVDRLVTLAENNHWFHDTQAGFRKRRNCTDQILRLVQRVDDGFQKKEKSILALLDLSKAYDRVWNQKLIYIMHEQGVPLKILRWINNFLQNRQGRVRLNNAEGKCMLIPQGLPQGSVLAPILFLFYINTLAVRLPCGAAITNSLFADDVSILSSAKTLKEAEAILQKSVDIVLEWAVEFKMELSTKSEVTFFSMNSHDASWTPSVSIGSTPIKFEPSPRLLGVHLDRTLCFTKHVDAIRKKMGKKCRMLGAVANSEWGWPKKQLVRLYNTQARPVLDYGAPAWQPWVSETNVEKLNASNRKAIRMITGQSRDTHIPSLHAESGICSYNTIMKQQTLIAREKALRCPDNHPSRIAAEGPACQRLKKEGFRMTAEKLAVEFLPPEAANREPFDMDRVTPWESVTDFKITPSEKGTSKKETADDVLRRSTLAAIRECHADVVIYTDGSCDAGVRKGGSAAVVTSGDPERPVVAATLSRRGKNITCSYEEEIEAMKLALEWLETEATPNTKVLICTDSNSLCDALMFPRETEMAKLHNALARTDVDLEIRWVPAHVDIPGNELADQAAKQATRLDSAPLNTSFKAVKALVKRSIIDQPADPVKYKLSRTVYDTYRPTTDEQQLKTRAEQTLIAKIRTGKWKKFRAYQSKLDDNTTDENCLHCPGKTHDMPHWLLECTATYELRQRLFGTTDTTR